MQFDNEEEAINEQFPDLTKEQMWAIVKIIKHCRKRCRNNAALNNYLNRNFTKFRFVEVEKVDSRTGERYKGLEIHDKE